MAIAEKTFVDREKSCKVKKNRDSSIAEKRFIDHKKKICRSQMEKYSSIVKTTKFADHEDFKKNSGWRSYLSMSKFVGLDGLGTRRLCKDYL